MQSHEDALKNALSAVSTWEEAVDALVALRTQNDECYSSGEIADDIRRVRTDLVFRVQWVGQRLQNAMAAGSLPQYQDGFGGFKPAIQVVRQTTGLGRTQAGISVFVYGPDDESALDWPFERHIALPGPQGGNNAALNTAPLSAAALAMMGSITQPVQAGPTPPVTTNTPGVTAVVAQGKAVPADVLAKVHSDGRICVSKLAFEALAWETKTPIVGGEALYVVFTPGKATITQAPPLSGGSTKCYPTCDHCRLHLSTPDAYPVGAQYRIIVSTTGLEIDFTQAF